MITSINESNFNDLKADDSTLKVLKIGAEWCAACKAIHPVMEKFSESYSNVKFYDMDADQNSDFVVNMGVRALPTFIFFKDGEEIESAKGLNHITLKKKIEEFN